MLQKLVNKILNRIKYQFNYYERFRSLSQLQDSKLLTHGLSLNLSKLELNILKDNGLTFANRKFKYHLGYECEPVIYGILSNAELFGNSGACAYNNELIADSYNFAERIIYSTSFRNIQVRKKVVKKGLFFALFSMPYAKNPYHLIIEDLPKLLVLNQIKEQITVLIPEGINKKYRKLIIDAINEFPNAQIEVILENENWVLERLLLVSPVVCQNSGYLGQYYVQFIQEIVARVLNLTVPAANNKLLFISRAKAQTRKLNNEEEICYELRKIGFDVLELDDLSLHEQVKIFRQAKIVVAPHGAGIHNFIFTNKCTLLELQPENFIKTHDMFLAKASGGNYQLIKGSQIDESNNFTADPFVILDSVMDAMRN